MTNPRPRILVLTRGDYQTCLALRDLLRARDRYDVGVIVITGDDRGRTGRKRFESLWRSSDRRYLAYEAAQQGTFALVAKLVPRAGVDVRSLARDQQRALLVTRRVNGREALGFARRFEPDLLVSVKCPQRIRAALLDLAPGINVHASLLPRHAGRAPQFWALADGALTTGTTIHTLTPELDAGNVLVQREFPLRGGESAFAVLSRANRMASPLLLEAVELALAGCLGIPQDRDARSYHSTPTPAAYRRLRGHGFRLMRTRELLVAVVRELREAS